MTFTVETWLPIGISLVSAGAAVAAWWAAWAQAKASQAQVLIIERQDFNQAAASFRAQFVSAQFYLRQNLRGNSRDVISILSSDVIGNHEQTKILFEPHLCRSQLEALDVVWHNYANHPKSPSPGNLEQRQKDTRLALEQIDTILAFAKPR